MYIETEHLVIRDLKEYDAPSFIHMISDGSLRDIFGDCTDAKDWMSDWIIESKQYAANDNPLDAYLAYAIVQKATGLTIGSVGCSYYNDLKKTGVTYFIGNEFRRKGYATEALLAYIQYFFRHYKINELIATIRTENIGSCKVVENVGFTLTDTKMYQDINDSNPERYNFYELTRDSFNQNRQFINK